MNPLYYNVAQHIFELSDPEQMGIKRLLPSFEPFAIPAEEAGKPLFSMVFTPRISSPQEKQEITTFEWEGAQCTIFRTPEGYEVKISPDYGSDAYSMFTNQDFTHAVAQLHPARRTNTFVVNNFLMMLYAFATAPHNTLMFHASVIRHTNKGYLFMGKSGTGKSTHSSLWLKHIPGSELLNDDNPIVRQYEDGRVVVYGSPWSGKTPCYRNEEAEVGAFVRLKQAPENRITRDKPAKAFASLLPSCSCLKQHAAQYDSICQTIAEIAVHTPVWQLECKPDAEAARICYEAIH